MLGMRTKPSVLWKSQCWRWSLSRVEKVKLMSCHRRRTHVRSILMQVSASASVRASIADVDWTGLNWSETARNVPR